MAVAMFVVTYVSVVRIIFLLNGKNSSQNKNIYVYL